MSFPLRANLSKEAKAALDEIQRLGRFALRSEALARAISDELFIQEQLADGCEVLVRKNGRCRVLVWPLPPPKAPVVS